MRITLLFLLFSTYSVFGQYGHYKKQYEVFDWKVLQTQNLTVHYVDGQEYVAEFTAQNGENFIKSIRRELSLPFTAHLNLFVYGSHNTFQQTNVVGINISESIKGLTEGYLNRVLLPFEGDYNYFRITIHHELVHAFLNQYFEQMASFPMGRRYMPSWMNEGLASYLSEGDLDCASDMYARSYLLGNDSKLLEEEGGIARYNVGQAFYTWLKHKEGDDIIGVLVRQLATRSSIDAAFRSAIGSGYKITMADFTEDLKKMYRKESSYFKLPDGFAEMLVRPVSKDVGSYCSSVTLSPDGTKLAYIGNDSEEFGIYLRDYPLDFESKLIIRGWDDGDFQELLIGNNNLSWSPDGKKLLFVAKSDGLDLIYIYDVASATTEPIKLPFQTIRDVVWGKDGKFLAISAVQNQHADIFVARLSDKSLTQITNDIYLESSLCWNADYTKLFFVSDRDSVLTSTSEFNAKDNWFINYNHSDIYSIDVTTKNIERLTNEPTYHKSEIKFLPNQNSIVYLSDKNGINNIYVHDLDKKRVKHLTNSASGIYSYCFDNSLKTLAFVAMNNSGSDIFTLNKPMEYKCGTDTLVNTTCRIFLDNNRYFDKRDTTNKQDSLLMFTVDKERIAINSIYGRKLTNVKLDSFTLQQFSMVSSKRAGEYKPGFNFYDDNIFVDYDDIRMSPTLNANMYFTDVAGNHSWGLFGNVSYTRMGFSDFAGDFGYYIGASYEYKKYLLDYYAGVYHLAYTFPHNLQEAGAKIDVSHIFSENSKISSGLTLISASESRVIINNNNPEFTRTKDTSAMYTTFDVVYTFNTWRRESMSGQSGTYSRLKFRLSPKISEGGADFGYITADLRKYFSIFHDTFGFMARFAVGSSFGNDALNFHVGGVDGWLALQQDNMNNNGMLYSSLQDMVFNQRQNMRGYNIAEISGKSYAVGTLELRFPFLNPLRAMLILYPQLWSLTSPTSMASLYFDMGTAFNSSGEIAYRDMDTIPIFQYPYQRTQIKRGTVLKSLGISMSFNFLGLDMRFDIVKPYLNGNFIDTRYLISIGDYF